jgi:hypothetical protein
LRIGALADSQVNCAFQDWIHCENAIGCSLESPLKMKILEYYSSNCIIKETINSKLTKILVFGNVEAVTKRYCNRNLPLMS